MDNKNTTQNHIGTISLMGFCYDFHRQPLIKFRWTLHRAKYNFRKVYRTFAVASNQADAGRHLLLQYLEGPGT